MKKNIDELVALTEFSDTSRDYIDDLTGDYIFFIAGHQYKFRKAKYKLQRRIVNLLSELDTSDIPKFEEIQDFIFSLIFLKQGDKWVLLEEDEMEFHLLSVEYRPVSYLNMLFMSITRRLIPNFTDAGVVKTPANSNPPSVEDSKPTQSQRKSLTT